jgi:ATP-dependent Lon protease
MIMLVAQKDLNAEDPKAADLYAFGTVSVIMRMLKLPDGRVRILVQGFSRAQVQFFDESKPYITAKVQPRTEPQLTAVTPELEALIRTVKSTLESAWFLWQNISPDSSPSPRIW